MIQQQGSVLLDTSTDDLSANTALRSVECGTIGSLTTISKISYQLAIQLSNNWNGDAMMI